tara:strand:+ start:1229 stop:2719 length:1491 start_codon:yes stop_codon:yes gene_type:complete
MRQHSDKLAHSIGIGETSVAEIAIGKYIKNNYGIALAEHQQATLVCAIKKICNKFNYPDASALYLDMVDNVVTTQVMELLIDEITVGETYFFRDSKQMALLRNKLLPELIQNKQQQQNKTLRIWSAGCSSGDELYSVAIILRELIADISEWNIHLVGTDINLVLIQQALAGKYSHHALRKVDNTIASRYFSRSGDSYQLTSEIMQMAKFSYLNLIDDYYPSFINEINNIDLILCRNVFIYFSEPTIRDVLNKITQCLTESGVLMLGASDYWGENISGLEKLVADDVCYFQRGVLTLNDIIEAINPDKKKYTANTTHSVTGNRLNAEGEQEIISEVTNEDAQIKLDKSDKLIQVFEQQHSKDSINAIVEASQQLATAGKVDEAIASCKKALEIDEMDINCNYLYGQLLAEKNLTEEAVSVFKKIVYLAPKMPEAHYYLGVLSFRNGNKDRAIKHMMNTVTLAKQKASDAQVLNESNMTYSRLAEIVEHEITIYSEIR